MRLPPCTPADGPAPDVPAGTALPIPSAAQAFVHWDGAETCFRRAGCLPFSLPVLSGDGAFMDIERYEEGQAVRACGRDLAWSSRAVAFCNGLPEIPQNPHGIIIAFADTAIVVTVDHIFMLADGSLCRADRLTPADALMAADGRPMEIASLHAGDYLGSFFRIATAIEAPNEALDGHLLNTNGVVSGDYAVQIFARAGALDKLFRPDHATAPVIGSAAYVERHGAACLRTPDLDRPGMRVHLEPAGAIA